MGLRKEEGEVVLATNDNTVMKCRTPGITCTVDPKYPNSSGFSRWKTTSDE
jgi:hypothetical protein